MGLSTQKLDDKIWRFYITTANNEIIQVAQSLNRRNKTIQETAFSLMAPQLIFIPILIGVIFIAISKALSPLNALSVSIQQRQSNALQPFSPDKMPGEIKPLVNALNQFMLRVSDMVDILKRFTSDAAHELRTPITALKIQLSLLEKSKNKAERDQAIEALKSGIDRSEQLVSQLLTLARIEPNNQTRQFEAIDLNGLVKESIQELLPLALVKSIDLGLENLQSDHLQLDHSQFNHSLLDNAKVAFINAVPYEIKILINNMIDNAIRYTPADGKVDVSILRDDQKVILMVNDSGPGIALTDIEHVFDRFYRGQNKDSQSSSLSSNFGSSLGLNLSSGIGSGLGLSIVKEIATQHDATIKTAQLNPGFSISVIFPTAN